MNIVKDNERSIKLLVIYEERLSRGKCNFRIYRNLNTFNEFDIYYLLPLDIVISVLTY